jgi:FAD-linked oxidoreductase
MISRRKFLLASLLTPFFASFTGKHAFASAAEFSPQFWTNWSGALSANPGARIAPASEAELIQIISELIGEIRPVGAGHSFSPLVPTNGNLVVLDKMSGLLSHNAEQHSAVLAAGTRLSDAGPLLAGVGQAMFNLPDIDRQTLAGAISTSTHGTGLGFKSLSGYVNSIRLVTPSGRVIELDRSADEERFLAARVSLGALGVVTQVGFQNRTPFRLKTKSWVESTADVIASFDARSLEYQHYEFLPFPHADYSLVIAHKETTEDEIAPIPEEDSGDLFAMLNRVPVSMRSYLFNFLLGEIPATQSVEASYRALTNVRNDRFNEMEYSVPLASGLSCVSEVLQVIRDEAIDVVFPLEYRTIDEDDSWLSMFNGGPRASISIHRTAGLDYRPYFDRIEKIFLAYGGRPHWGKLHTLGFAQLNELYPQLKDFVGLQKEFDPKGQMLNAHLAHLLGH